MTSVPRGKIRNKERARQIRDYTGLSWGKITPTDIDGFIDFGGQTFVFIEIKYGDAPLPFGQRRAMERLCDACQAGGKEALLLVASHSVPPDEEIEIDVAELPVREYRWSGNWHKPRASMTVRKLIDDFKEWAEEKNWLS